MFKRLLPVLFLASLFSLYLAERSEPLSAENTIISREPCTDGSAFIFDCKNIDLAAQMPLSSIGGGGGNDIWGWTDPLTGKEYALMLRTSGTSFVDVSDPENPVYLGNLPTHTSNSSWRDAKVHKNYAYIVSEAPGHGMQVFDLTELRDVASPPVTFSETVHYNAFGNAHNIALNDDSGVAYAVGTNTCSGGLHIIDLKRPAEPFEIGCFSADGYTHDVQCVTYAGPDTDHTGKEICLASNEDTLTIVDLSDLQNPVELSRTGYAGSSYAHQGWLSEDHATFFLDDELDESGQGFNTRTYVWDVVDLDAPTLLGFNSGATPAIDHNQYVINGMTFQSNYTAGLRVLDTTAARRTPNNLSERAYFDTYPSNDSTSFNGTWSNYPFFESGTIIVSDISGGLFILQPHNLFGVESTTAMVEGCTGEPTMTSVDVSLVELYDFSGMVNLSLIDVPAELSATLVNNSEMAPGTATINVSMDETVPSGSYSFVLQATHPNDPANVAEATVTVDYVVDTCTLYYYLPLIFND